MDTYEFPKHPDTELKATEQQAARQFKKRILQYPPCAYGIFTFDREPPNLDVALGHVDNFCKRLSGELHKSVWYWAGSERGGVNDRRHCHVFLYGYPALVQRDYYMMHRHWLHGRILQIAPFEPGGGAEWYMASKMAAGRERAWDMSNKLARRIGKLESSANSSDPSTD